jgi:hypothetical protein
LLDVDLDEPAPEEEDVLYVDLNEPAPQEGNGLDLNEPPLEQGTTVASRCMHLQLRQCMVEVLLSYFQEPFMYHVSFGQDLI